MKKDLLIVGVLIFIFAVSISVVGYHFSDKKIVNPFAIPTPYPTTSIQPTIEDQTTTETPNTSRNIEVLEPNGGDIVKSGFAVKGNARVFENHVSIRLLDSNSNILVQTFTIADAPDAGQFGSFEKMIYFSTNDESGTLEVYQASAKDGSEIDKVTVPVIFKNNSKPQ